MLRVRTVLSGWPGGPGLQTMYFETPLQDAAAAARAVAYVHSFWGTTMIGQLTVGTSVQVSGDVDVITAATGLITNTLSVAVPAPLAGSGGTTQAPYATASLMQLRTGTFIAGRRLQGRIFFSPLPGLVVGDNGELTSAAQTRSNLAGTSLLGALSAGDLWVVWHRPKLGVGGSIGPITAVSTPTKLAVLTSRRD